MSLTHSAWKPASSIAGASSRDQLGTEGCRHPDRDQTALCHGSSMHPSRRARMRRRMSAPPRPERSSREGRHHRRRRGRPASAPGCSTAQHDVTLFEKDDRLGGHAHTIEIEAHGQRIAVDAGFQFFGAGAGVRDLQPPARPPRGRRGASYPATLRSIDAGAAATRRAMPPFRGGRPVWSSLTPSAIVHADPIPRFLAGVPAFLEQHDRTVTIAEYLEQQRLPRAVRATSSCFRCCCRSGASIAPDFLRFAAYNALYYLGANLPAGLARAAAERDPRRDEGLRRRAGAAAWAGRRASDTAAASRRITRDARRLSRSRTHAGDRHPFDQRRRRRRTRARRSALIESIPELEPVCRAAAPIRVLRHDDRDPRRSAPDACRASRRGRSSTRGGTAPTARCRSGTRRAVCRSSRAG